MTHHKHDPLKQLALADPDLAETVKSCLMQKAGPVLDRDIALLVDETLWALSAEIAFGRAVAEGYADLLGAAGPQKIGRYRRLVREFGRKGPTLGRIMATVLVPVCKYGDDRLIARLLDTLDVMLAKGTYTLKDPLKALSALLNAKDADAASAYLDLLKDTFAGKLSYVQSQHFAHILPRAVQNFPAARRVWQIEQLRRVIRADALLADAFLDGFAKGLHLLSQTSLAHFVSLGLAKLTRSRKPAAKFLSLESKLAADTFAEIQVTVPLSQVQAQLNRYVRARTGLSLAVRPLSDLPDVLLKSDRHQTFVCSDGKFIYLPAEISAYPDKAQNINLYKCLTRIEAGHYEFDTFDFDLERVLERCRGISECGFRSADFKGMDLEADAIRNLEAGSQNHEHLSDPERFFSLFPLPVLAADLFTVFEHGRVRVLLGRHYAGLVRQTFPVLHKEAVRTREPGQTASVVLGLYLWIALGLSLEKIFGFDKKILKHLKQCIKLFEKKIQNDPVVETCAELVAETYPKVAEILQRSAGNENLAACYRPLATPFGRRIRPDLFFLTHRRLEQIAARLKTRIAQKGFKVYKSDIRRHLIANNQTISHDDLKSIIVSPGDNSGLTTAPAGTTIDLSWLDLSEFFGAADRMPLCDNDVNGPVFWYKEWDCNLQDYLSAHVRVLDKTISGKTGEFYADTLKRHQGLVKRIRYAFELLKPEGLVRLRQWVEGDEFDYRALLDFAVDKKAGKIPSDRLYIKRIKQTRDVAVLLLVDLSRSTANAVNGSQMRVLDVEKEAIVLFCEALEVVGDAFAIAGFSGTGRLGVDYYRIKDFDE
ncbi:MAG: hypothetical protein KKH68_08015, partial [Proteobacteria bacterium]|nr:hypothetical protein [Pseudomonadota bacterium]